MPKKLIEHTYGTHIYMRIRLDNKRIEEIVKSKCSEYEFTTVHNLFCEVLAKLEKIGMANYKK